MKQVFFTLAAVVAFSLSIVGCRGELEVDPDTSASIVAPN